MAAKQDEWSDFFSDRFWRVPAKHKGKSQSIMFICLRRRISHQRARHREFVKATYHPLFIRAATSARRFNVRIFARNDRCCNSPKDFSRYTAFRVKSRPDFPCYLFDESWRRSAEFRGNPGRGCATEALGMRVKRGWNEG